MTDCRFDLQVLDIYTYGIGASTGIVALSSANIRGRPKSKLLVAHKTNAHIYCHHPPRVNSRSWLFSSEPPNEWLFPPQEIKENTKSILSRNKDLQWELTWPSTMASKDFTKRTFWVLRLQYVTRFYHRRMGSGVEQIKGMVGSVYHDELCDMPKREGDPVCSSSDQNDWGKMISCEHFYPRNLFLFS